MADIVLWKRILWILYWLATCPSSSSLEEYIPHNFPMNLFFQHPSNAHFTPCCLSVFLIGQYPL